MKTYWNDYLLSKRSTIVCSVEELSRWVPGRPKSQPPVRILLWEGPEFVSPLFETTVEALEDKGDGTFDLLLGTGDILNYPGSQRVRRVVG